MTNTIEPQPLKICSESNAASKKSICPGKSHIYDKDKQTQMKNINNKINVNQIKKMFKKDLCNKEIQTLNCTNELFEISSFMIFVVLSRNNVSLGDIL